MDVTAPIDDLGITVAIVVKTWMLSSLLLFLLTLWLQSIVRLHVCRQQQYCCCCRRHLHCCCHHRFCCLFWRHKSCYPEKSHSLLCWGPLKVSRERKKSLKGTFPYNCGSNGKQLSCEIGALVCTAWALWKATWRNVLERGWVIQTLHFAILKRCSFFIQKYPEAILVSTVTICFWVTFIYSYSVLPTDRCYNTFRLDHTSLLRLWAWD